MSKNKPNKGKKVARVLKTMRPVDNSREVAYRKLLLDPCNAEITTSPYGGDAGSICQRTHKIYNNTTDAYLVFFHPVLGTYIVDGVGLQNIRPLNGATQITGGNARAIAGCVEVMYQGAESARAGTVHCGVVPGGIVWNYVSVALGGGGSQMDLINVAARFQNITRTPVDRCAVNWFPGDGDTDWIPPITLNSAQGGATEKYFASTHFAAIYVAGAGTNNMRFSETSVYEAAAYQATSAGTLDVYPWAIQAKTTPPINVEKVLRELSNVDSKWYLDTFKKVAKFGVGLIDSTFRGGLPGALGYLTSQMVDNTSYGGKSGRVIRSGS
jgi:hypothetical protein